MIKLNFYLPKPQLEKLQKESRETGLSIAELIRRAIDLYFRKKR